MALIYPFRAYRYNPEVAPFDRVLTQPYDKISPAQQEKYYAANPHNLIAVEKGRTSPQDMPQDNVYTRAAAALKGWIAANAVQQDAAPALYAYTQEFTVPGTSTRRTRRGFIGAGQLEDYANNVVFRHEHTLSGPKADRLELLRHTHTHTGQLFMIYSDPEKRVDAILSEVESAEKPLTELLDEYGVTHRLWMIADPALVAAIQKAMDVSPAQRPNTLAAGMQADNKFIRAIRDNTISLTTLTSGVGSPPKVNVIPSVAEATLDCRLMPGVNAAEFISEMKARINNPRVTIERLNDPVDAGVSPADTPLFAALRAAVLKEHPDAVVTPILLPYGTDSVNLRKRGVTAYGFEPMVLDAATVATMHSDEERIPVAEFLRGIHIFYDVLRSEF